MLAIAGGLTWWQRSVTPVDIPHPQDEAEIMTAVLERAYAMGRTNTQFTTAYAAHVLSTQAGGTNPYTVYTTNSPAHTDTNTVGYWPNATYQYPDAIRSAITPTANTFWIVPQTNYTQYGDASITWTQYPTKYLNSDTNWWTSFVTFPTGTYTTTTNYTLGDGTHVSHIYTNNTSVNVMAGNLFAFERDKNSLDWYMNAYNDMARALALMQWQLDINNKAKAIPSIVYTANYIYNSSGMSLVNDGWSSWFDHEGYGLTFSGYLYNNATYYTNNPTITMQFQIAFKPCVISNTTPFDLSNMTVLTAPLSWTYADHGPTTNGVNAIYWIMPTNYSIGYGGLHYVSAATIATMPSGSTTSIVMGAISTNDAASIVAAEASAVLPGIWSAVNPDHASWVPTSSPYSLSPGTTNILRIDSMYGTNLPPIPLPSLTSAYYETYNISRPNANIACAYKVNFQAITNYLNHTPIR